MRSIVNIELNNEKGNKSCVDLTDSQVLEREKFEKFNNIPVLIDSNFIFKNHLFSLNLRHSVSNVLKEI